MVIPCKGLPCAGSSPACAQLLCGIVVEATDISAHKRDPCHARLQHILHSPCPHQHGHPRTDALPGRVLVQRVLLSEMSAAIVACRGVHTPQCSTANRPNCSVCLLSNALSKLQIPEMWTCSQTQSRLLADVKEQGDNASLRAIAPAACGLCAADVMEPVQCK